MPDPVSRFASELNLDRYGAVIIAGFIAAGGAFVTDPAGQVHTIHGALRFAAAIVLFFASIPPLGWPWAAAAGTTADSPHTRR